MSGFVAKDVPNFLIGDPSRLRQILLNLLSNAVKFTSLGEVSLEVSLEGSRAADTDEACLLFQVSDTGIGISAEQQKKLFKPFSQADESTSRKFGGTGLGLSIVKLLVDLFGGQINLQSREGRGSTFSFAISLNVDRDANRDPRALFSLSDQDLSRFKDLHVLIVDDNATNCMSLELLMSQLGARVKSERMGADGIATLKAADLKNDPFNLLLLDYHMPSMNGIDVARAVGSQMDHPPKIIALSSSLDHELLLKELHISAATAKPIRKKPLLYLISRIMWGAGVDERKRLLKEAQPGETSTLRKSSAPPSPPPPSAKPTSRASEEARAPEEKNASAPRSVEKTRLVGASGEVLEFDPADVLVVDDTPLNRSMLSALLGGLNLQPSEAVNGVEALQQASNGGKDFKVILMDLHMPVLNGIDATRLLRKRGFTGPILALTADTTTTAREEAKEAGIDQYLLKPIRKQVLVDALTKAGLNAKSPPGSAESSMVSSATSSCSVSRKVSMEQSADSMSPSPRPSSVAQKSNSNKPSMQASDQARVMRRKSTVTDPVSVDFSVASQTRRGPEASSNRQNASPRKSAVKKPQQQHTRRTVEQSPSRLNISSPGPAMQERSSRVSDAHRPTRMTDAAPSHHGRDNGNFYYGQPQSMPYHSPLSRSLSFQGFPPPFVPPPPPPGSPYLYHPMYYDPYAYFEFVRHQQYQQQQQQQQQQHSSFFQSHQATQDFYEAGFPDDPYHVYEQRDEDEQEFGQDQPFQSEVVSDHSPQKKVSFHLVGPDHDSMADISGPVAPVSVTTPLPSAFKPRILLVDDVKTNRIYARHILRKAFPDALVDEADGSAQCLAKLESVRYDIIFMDLVMPVGMDGIETTKAILQTIPDAVIVGMTGYDEAHVNAECIHAGMRDVICKPFKPDDFKAMISRYVSSQFRSVSSDPPQKNSSHIPSIRVDKEMLLEMGPIAGQLLDAWQSNMISWVNQMREALCKGDTKAMADLLHTVAGSSAQIGAVSVHDLARTFEKNGVDMAGLDTLDEVWKASLKQL